MLNQVALVAAAAPIIQHCPVEQDQVFQDPHSKEHQAVVVRLEIMVAVAVVLAVLAVLLLQQQVELAVLEKSGHIQAILMQVAVEEE
jgi:hypothetical protein